QSKPVHSITVYYLFPLAEICQYQHLILFVESKHSFVLGIHWYRMESGRKYFMALSDFYHLFNSAEDNAFHSTLVMTVCSLIPIHRRTVEPSGIMGDFRIFFILPPVQLANFISAVEKRDTCIRNNNAVQKKNSLH